MITDKTSPLHEQISYIAHECSKELYHEEAHELSIIAGKVKELEDYAAVRYLEELADKLNALADFGAQMPEFVRTELLHRLATEARNHNDTPEENSGD